MHDEFEAFLIEPTRDAYERARDALLADPAFRADPCELAEAGELCAAGEFSLARRRIEEMLFDWALSPRVHFLAARAAEELGDLEDAELERFTARACLAGLLATGNGSFACPFLVTYSSDEHDLLAVLRLQARSQQLISCDSGWFDVVTCVDGSERWFDVTDLLPAAPLPSRPLARTSA